MGVQTYRKESVLQLDMFATVRPLATHSRRQVVGVKEGGGGGALKRAECEGERGRPREWSHLGQTAGQHEKTWGVEPLMAVMDDG